MNFIWDTLTVLTEEDKWESHPGLAGIITGVIDSTVIIAGGSNFKDGLPWNGGIKYYYDDIYLLGTDCKGTIIRWEKSPVKLPASIAYSASVTVNNRMLCMGGENVDGVQNSCCSIEREGNGIILGQEPGIPVGVSSPGAAVIGAKVYLAGGIYEDGFASNRFFLLDLSTEQKEWKEIASLPYPVSHAIVVSQWDGSEECVFLIGGRNNSGDITEFFSDIWKYSPSGDKWIKAGTIGNDKKSIGLSAGTGLAFGDNGILIFGGDDGILYNKTEQYNLALKSSENITEKKRIQEFKISHLDNHPGFNRDIYYYDTVTRELAVVGKIPGKAQVTTQAIWHRGKIVIPMGEIRPGIRTPVVMSCMVDIEAQ
ncbi:MAG: kelch repeat-containing protein [Bacteroidota bacterium]|nr:kelch repeat-containing protein [Bacteroidota bacterium]